MNELEPQPENFPDTGVKGLVILVVGGTSGLGLSGARALARAGARVVITGREKAKLDVALDKLGSGVVGSALDATAPEAAQEAVDLAVDHFGRLDGLYHVAGGSGRLQGDGALHHVSDEGIDYTLDLNLKSIIYTNRAAVQQFLHQTMGGAILNATSVLAYSPSPDYFASHIYTAAKSAIIGFSKSLASYYGRDGIRVNVIAPALVDTPMAKRATGNDEIMTYIEQKQPLDGGRIGRPDDLDAAVLFFFSGGAHFVTGQVLAVDGGWTVSEGRPPKL